jgi:hypothetical protein
MTYDADTELIDVFVYGPAGVCGQVFEDSKTEQEPGGIVFEQPGSSGSAGGNDGINRLRK